MAHYLYSGVFFQVEIHKKEADDLMEKVEALEKANLYVMSELFECTVDDLKISRYRIGYHK